MRQAVLAIVIALAVLELALASVVYRDRVGEDDWTAVGERLEGLDGPIVVGDPWLAPRARMALPALRDPSQVGRADLHGAPQFHVVRLHGTAWQSPIPAKRVTSRSAGAFVVDTFEVVSGAQTIASFVPTTVEGGERRCTPTAPASTHAWSCGEQRASVRQGLFEIDYTPRHCWQIDLASGTTARLRHAAMPMGDRLRGHIGFTDFNGVLRSDAPARVELWVDGELRLRFVASDEQGWLPFELATARGHADVELRVTVATRGQWGRAGYVETSSRPACVELRALQEAE